MKTGYRFWKLKEIGYLKSHQFDKRKEIARKLHRDQEAIKSKMHKLGLLKRRKWTIAEESLLKNLVDFYNIFEIADILDRTEMAIRNKMRKLSLKIQEKIIKKLHSDKLKACWQDPIYKKHVVNGTRKFWNSKQSNELRKSRSSRLKRFHKIEEWEENRIDGIRNSVKFREAASERMRKIGSDPKYFAKRFQHRKMTKPELFLQQIINELKLPFKFVGNGEVVISGLNPDFINTNGKKQLIDVFGDYWHTFYGTPSYGKENIRKHIFKRIGFDDLIIWEHELKHEPEEVKKKLLLFSEEKHV